MWKEVHQSFRLASRPFRKTFTDAKNGSVAPSDVSLGVHRRARANGV